jgi:hypothetical protein
MHYFLIGCVALLFALIAFKLVYPLLRPADPVETAAGLDRDEAHEMLDRYIRYMALSVALPGHFHSGERDAKAATAAMMRIMEIEGEPPDAEAARAFVDKLASDRAEEMVKGGGKYPIVFDDMWPL